MERIVTIFGGSKCGEDSEEYVQAHRVGELLAEAGVTICTGGYLGVMEAASRGADARGGGGGAGERRRARARRARRRHHDKSIQVRAEPLPYREGRERALLRASATPH